MRAGDGCAVLISLTNWTFPHGLGVPPTVATSLGAMVGAGNRFVVSIPCHPWLAAMP
jgi:hypothetical protein